MVGDQGRTWGWGEADGVKAVVFLKRTLWTWVHHLGIPALVVCYFQERYFFTLCSADEMNENWKTEKKEENAASQKHRK